MRKPRKESRVVLCHSRQYEVDQGRPYDMLMVTARSMAGSAHRVSTHAAAIDVKAFMQQSRLL